MTATELNASAVEAIGGGNLVEPIERLKSLTAELLDHLDRIDRPDQASLAQPQQMQACIDDLSDETESFLAVAFPLIEYGGPEGHRAVAAALRRLARRADRRGVADGFEAFLYVILARLLWGLTTYALATDRLELLTRLAGLATQSDYDPGRPQALVADARARYLAAYDRDAGTSFEAHLGWLESLDLFESYPLLVAGDELKSALMEADMILGMCLVAESGLDPYSAGARQEWMAERRLVARVADPRQRRALAEFFGCSEEDLEARLSELHAGLRQGGAFRDRTPLFPAAEAQE
jgi:hypothetical protein